MTKQVLIKSVFIVAVVLAVGISASLWYTGAGSGHSGDAETDVSSVQLALAQVLRDQPKTAQDKDGWDLVKKDIENLRLSAEKNPQQAIALLATGPKYSNEIVAGVLESQDGSVVQQVDRIVRSKRLEPEVCQEIVYTLAPERLSGKRQEECAVLLRALATDTDITPLLRAAAVQSLSGDYGTFIGKDEQTQGAVLALWAEGKWKDHPDLRMSLLFALSAGMPWKDASEPVKSALNQIKSAPQKDSGEVLSGLWTRFAAMNSGRISDNEGLLLPTDDDAEWLLAIMVGIFRQPDLKERWGFSAEGITSGIIARYPGNVSSKAVGDLIQMKEDDVLLSAVLVNTMSNHSASNPAILAYALSRLTEPDLASRNRKWWLASLARFLVDDGLSQSQLAHNRTYLFEHLPPLLTDPRFDQHDVKRIRELIEACSETTVAWERVSQAGERLRKLVEEGSTSVDDYSRIALDALLDFKLDIYNQAMSKVARFGPKSQIALRLKASTSMYVNHNLQEYKANLDELVAAYPDFADGYGQSAYCYLKSGEYEKASADVNKAVELGSNSSVTYIAWGMVLMHQHDFVAAAEKLRKAVSLTSELKDPNIMPEDFVSANLATETWLGLGISLFAQGKWNEAGEQFAKDLEKFRMNDEVLLWAYVSALLSGDTAAPKGLFTKWVKDVRGYKLSTGAQDKFVGFLVEGADSAAILKLLADNRNSASWSGDGMYVAGKWLWNKGEKELAKAYFTKAAQMAKDFFFAAVLANYELTKITEGK